MNDLSWSEISRVQCPCGWMSHTVRGPLNERVKECQRLQEEHLAAGCPLEAEGQ